MSTYTVKILHVSDTHLGAKPYGLLDRERDVYDVFGEVVEIALREEVDAVLHAGDMFDRSTPKPSSLMVAVKSLKMLREKGIEFYVSPGNHEHPKSIDEGSPIRLLELINLAKGPDPRVQAGPTIYRVGRDDKVIVAVFPPTGLSSLRSFRVEKKKDEALILLAHARLCDAMMDTEGIPPERCGALNLFSSDLNTNADYVALGDLHLTWEGRLPRGGKIVYPGATEHFAVDEYERSSGKRYVYLIRIEDGLLAEVRRIELKRVRPWIIVRAPYSQVSALVERMDRSPGKPPLLYIDVSDPIDRIKRDRLIQKLRSLTHNGVILDYVLHARHQHPLIQIRERGTQSQQLDLGKMIEEIMRQLAKRYLSRDDCPGMENLVNHVKDFISYPSEDKAKSLMRLLEDVASSCR